MKEINRALASGMIFGAVVIGVGLVALSRGGHKGVIGGALLVASGTVFLGFGIFGVFYHHRRRG